MSSRTRRSGQGMSGHGLGSDERGERGLLSRGEHDVRHQALPPGLLSNLGETGARWPWPIVARSQPSAGQSRGSSEIFCQILTDMSVVSDSIERTVSSTTESVECSAHRAAVLATSDSISEQ